MLSLLDLRTGVAGDALAEVAAFGGRNLDGVATLPALLFFRVASSRGVSGARSSCFEAVPTPLLPAPPMAQPLRKDSLNPPSFSLPLSSAERYSSSLVWPTCPEEVGSFLLLFLAADPVVLVDSCCFFFKLLVSRLPLVRSLFFGVVPPPPAPMKLRPTTDVEGVW